MGDPAQRLKSSVEALEIAKVVRVDVPENKKQIRMLCKVSNERRPTVHQTVVAKAWLSVVDAILIEEERMLEEMEEEYESELAEYEGATEEENEGYEPPVRGLPTWSVHICKHYIRHNGRLVFAWNLTLQANAEMRSAVSDICRLLSIMKRHVESFLQQPVQHQSPATTPVVHTAPSRPEQQPLAGAVTVPGVGSAGVVQDGLVVEMPLIGVTANRNAPQAPMLTPGVQGMGRKSGVSSKGAHIVRAR
jgi:hypothetical protein